MSKNNDLSKATELSNDDYKKRTRSFNKVLARPLIDLLHQNNKKIITGLLSVLEKNGIKCFLDFNSLLGKVRDDNYIPWSNCIILSAIDEEYPCNDFIPKIKKIINNHYINENHVENMLYSSVIFCLHSHKKIIESLIDHQNKVFYDFKGLHSIYRTTLPFRKLEISIMSKSNTNQYWTYKRSNAVKPIHDSDIFPLKECDLNGIPTFMPSKNIKHLERLYGHNWQTPIINLHVF